MILVFVLQYYIRGRGIIRTGFLYDKNGKYELSCMNKTDVQAYIDIPIQAYDHYQAYTDNGEALQSGTGENNRLRLFIPGNYEGNIWIRFTVHALWRLSEFISFGTLGIIVVINVLYGNRRGRRGDLFFAALRQEKSCEKRG